MNEAYPEFGYCMSSSVW